MASAGCAGLPKFSLPDDGSGSGGGQVAGEATPGLLDGTQAADAPASVDVEDVPSVGGEPAGSSGDRNEAGPGVEATLDVPLPDTPALGWLVAFDRGTSEQKMRSSAERHGATFMFAFKALPVAYVMGTAAQLQRMAGEAGVVNVEREMPLAFHDAESRQAIRMPQLTHPVTGLKDAAGNPIDGRGVGIAVVDTGIDALHPDLPYGKIVPGGVVAANYKVASQVFVNMPNTDTTAGHGTHVAAIVAGQGIGDASVLGVAPASRLYGFGIGEASTTVWAAQAFDWILDNHATVNPPIRVVTNSWGTSGSYSATSTITLFVNALVDDGLTVVFSAGNGGGDGSVAKTSPECQNPKQGVVCVAAFDDLGTGTRDGAIAPYSSRGAASQASTWPDLSAPGTNVLSARPPVGTTTGFGTNVNYVQLSGTSQAAPHVAGTLALMLQKNPGATPTQLEAKLKATGYKFTDGGAYSGGTHLAKGFGLLDAYAAVAGI